MAGSVLHDRFALAGLAHRVAVETGGTSDWHVGAAADHRAQAALESHGYGGAHSARQFTADWFTEADLVLAMDYSNLLDLRAIAPDEEAASRVCILRSFDLTLMHLPEDDPELEVPDPYYGSQAGFIDTLRMIEAAADGVVDHVRLEL